jgi:hypothetical protein
LHVLVDGSLDIAVRLAGAVCRLGDEGLGHFAGVGVEDGDDGAVGDVWMA